MANFVGVKKWPDLRDDWDRALAVVKKTDAPCSILYRHSIRGHIPRDPDKRDVPLLPEGHELAVQLGQHIAKGLGASASVQLDSSPMRRCVDTSQGVAASLSNLSPLSPSRVLGDPGPFVRDPALAFRAYLQWGKYELVRKIALPESTRIDSFYPVDQGLIRFFAYLGPTHDTPKIRLACSHDIIMASIWTAVSGSAMSEEHWPNFCEPLVIVFGVDGVDVEYRGQIVRLSDELYQRLKSKDNTSDALRGRAKFV